MDTAIELHPHTIEVEGLLVLKYWLEIKNILQLLKFMMFPFFILLRYGHCDISGSQLH